MTVPQETGRHPFVRWALSGMGVFVVAAMMFGAIARQRHVQLTWEWHPYAFVVIAGICVIAAVMAYMLMYIRTPKAAVYWLLAMMFGALLWQTFILLEALSGSAEAASFWQSMGPLGWVTLTFTLLMFTLSYLDDVDIPRDFSLFIVPLMVSLALMYFAGATDLLETHVPHDPYFNALWGYGNGAGDYEPFAFLWVLAVALVVLTLFGGAYRRALSRRKRKQLLIFIIAISQLVFFATAIDILYYSFVSANFPPMSVMYSSALCLIIGYGILKHGIFNISPASLAEPILRYLSEGVVAVNADMFVEFANSGASVLFAGGGRDLRGQRASSLFGAPLVDTVRHHFARSDTDLVLEGHTVTPLKGHSHVRQPGVPVTISVSRIKGLGDNDFGYIFVVQNDSELKRKTLELAREKASVERKVAERTRELTEERARLAASIESLSLGFVLVDNAGKIIMQNSTLQQVFGFEHQPKTIADLSAAYETLDLDSFYKGVQQHTGRPASKEASLGAKTVRLFGAPVTVRGDDQHAVIGSVLVVEDITEAKVLERSRDEFFSIASHELRTPLTAIRGNSSMALEYYHRVSSDKALAELMTDIHDSSVRLIAIVNDFLDTSRLEQNRIVFSPRRCSVGVIVEGVLKDMKPIAEDRGLVVTANIESLHVLPELWIDENRVRQIIYNLVGNAVNYTDQGSVQVRGESDGASIIVYVQDTGRGISPEGKKLLFHKFQQAGQSLLTRDTAKGTGLGLYISRLLAQKMGGDLTLVSSKEGEGSTFKLVLPVGAPTDKRATDHVTHTINTSTGLTIKD